MKKIGVFGLLFTFILAAFLTVGCGRGTVKTQSSWGWDRNVSSWNKGKKKIRKRRRAYRSKRYNRAPLNR